LPAVIVAPVPWLGRIKDSMNAARGAGIVFERCVFVDVMDEGWNDGSGTTEPGQGAALPVDART
jgi:hypothetical protein